MRARMRGEINQLDRLFDRPERGVRHRIRRAGEGQNRAVVVRIGLAIEERHFGDRKDGANDRIQRGRVPPFGKVRNALHQLSWQTVSLTHSF